MSSGKIKELHRAGNTRIKVILVALIYAFFVPYIIPQNIPLLKFNEQGKFRIVQFTDIHLDLSNTPQSDSVIKIMAKILADEKPDFVILTGDIIASEKVKEICSAVTKPMIDAGIPWAVVFGNHDFEFGLTNKQIMDYLITLPLNCSQNGPENISGSGNYILEIKDKKLTKTEALLYCIDSHAYPTGGDISELGEYDWIKSDQIEWYRNTSKNYTLNNKGIPYPSLAFFHIPLPEYNNLSNVIGDWDEAVCSPKINSGMFDAFLACGDVMGVFTGHDHNNNYIGCMDNICLAYGCKTGLNSYGKLPKGARIIDLYEGERKFDTWIETVAKPVKYFVNYPGIKTTSIEKFKNTHVKFSLEQNYPNPFNPVTIIKYSIPESAKVTLKLYDILGREMSTLVNKNQVSGEYKIVLNAERMTSGVYFYLLTAGNFVSAKKMIFLK